MKKIFYPIYIALIALLAVSCTDRLDIPKHGNMGGMEDYYQTDEETMAALSSLYLSWRAVYYNWYFVNNLLADDVWAGGGSRGDNRDIEQLNEFTFSTEHPTIQNLYSGLYTLIYKANLIIDKVPGTTPGMRQAIAEARVVRAWAHFELVTLWGTAPAVTHLLEPDEYRPTNGTPETTWAFIEQDLQGALDSDALPSKINAEDQATGIRITKETCKALLGKAYLFQKKYTEAADILDQVVSSGLYRLYPDFDYLLHARADKCCESMLELQMRNDGEQSQQQWTYLYCMTGWRSDKLDYNGDAKTIFAQGTYGFFPPRKALYDAFVAEEGKDGYRLNCTLRSFEQMQAEGVTFKKGANWVGNEGYFLWKNRPLQEDCIYDNPSWQVFQYINFRIMRYAEVLLLGAEAHVMSGKEPDKAVDYVNQIRQRAHLKPLSTVTLDDIKTEKRLELCIESCRFKDLVRWGDAPKVLGEQGKQIPATGYFVVTDAAGNPVKDGNEVAYEFDLRYPYSNTVYGFKEKHKLLPIPLKEMQVNPNMKQNEGW